ncbi:oligosaccharide flippase family protein [Haloplanus rubicundus]|uniref:Lipopolysaccharide biosynthesis protein n=1 Tax=Haloplanus rubicundus TaxID=1547898 RepID=A0A345EG08_9EURY|nr:lipopolysaccharide biosynthesis protein [Haloplanus rubicundus]AXG11130.1 lipopolysaccharide biosynthesis protein [Haloplanus rubicundus]
MRLGQTSVVHFGSSIVSSVLGFAATVYIARMLGAEPLGIYHLSVGLVSWLAILGKVGISDAISKRVSEGVEREEYAAAGTAVVVAMFVVVAGGIVLFRGRVVDYVGYPVTGYIVLILLVVLLNSLINALLVGLHQVHVSGVLSPLRTGGRAVTQIALIAAGISTAGLFIGHAVGLLLGIVIGAYYVVRELPSVSLPERRHFERLGDFAKFSWLGGLQSQMFSYTDVVVLGFFVSSGLIGVYAVAWNVAQFLILFSGTIRTTLFPEMSAISAAEEPQAVARIVEQSLSFGGLLLIPGLFGGALLGERILRIYGPEFPKGTAVFTVLIVANLFMGYQNQLLNTLNAVDRPDLAFRVNGAFVGINLSLNVALVYLYGWLGAAAATAGSAAISLLVAYYYVSRLISFDVPWREIASQGAAALVMTAVVYAGLTVENTYDLLNHNFATVLVLVAAGATVYFVGLLGLSTEFRTTVRRNLPPLGPYLPG